MIVVEKSIFAANATGALVLRSDEVPDEEVQREMMILDAAFETLRMEVYEYISATKPDLNEFAVFVSCPVPSWKRTRPRQMTDVDLDRLMNPVAQFRDMFIVVNQYTNWCNYELMHKITERYGNPDLQGKMVQYRSEMVKFEARTSTDKLKNIELARPLADSVSIIGRLPDNHCNQFMASHMRRLKQQYANEAGLDHAALRIYMVRESSVEIIFLVPVTLAPYLMVSSLIVSPLLTSQDPLPQDMYERCVYYMHAEEVFRLMGVSNYGMSLIFIGVCYPTVNDKHSHMH